MYDVQAGSGLGGALRKQINKNMRGGTKGGPEKDGGDVECGSRVCRAVQAYAALVPKKQ